MPRFLLLLFVLVMVVSCSRKFNLNSGTIQQTDTYQTTIPIEIVKDKIIVTVSVNGDEGRYLVDTGAPMGISLRNQEKWQLKTREVLPVKDAYGARQLLSFVEVPSVQIGDLVYEDIPAIVISIKNSLLDCFDIDGIIGSNLLRLGAFQIDWEKQEMTIASSYRELGWSQEQGTPIFVNRKQSSPYIDVELSEGIVDRTLLDSGSDDFYVLGNVPFKRFQEEGKLADCLRYEGVGASGYGLFGASDKLESSLLVIDSVQLGSALFTAVGIEAKADDKSRIGTEFLQLGTFALDYPNRMFFFQSYPALADYSIVTFGLGFAKEEEALVVGRIWKDSPAWHAGIRPGDEVVDIKGFPMADRNFCDILLRLSAFRISQQAITITTVKKDTDIRMTHTLERLDIR
jgi:hypothetical protein